ncbi:MAG: hypothetical protein VZR00_10515 [Lachnospiraceae bacterium]|nr:hypothetical protein [Lachnospiraceae bacterium]
MNQIEKKPRKPRSSRQEVLQNKIDQLQEKIAVYSDKITSCQTEINNLTDELKALQEAEENARREEEMKNLLQIINDSGLSMEEIRQRLSQ